MEQLGETNILLIFVILGWCMLLFTLGFFAGQYHTIKRVSDELDKRGWRWLGNVTSIQEYRDKKQRNNKRTK